MSRYNKWTSAKAGIANWLLSQGFELDIREAGRPNRFMDIEVDNIIKEYSKKKKMQGSFTDRIIQITENFEEFKAFVNSKEWPKYKPQPK